MLQGGSIYYVIKFLMSGSIHYVILFLWKLDGRTIKIQIVGRVDTDNIKCHFTAVLYQMQQSTEIIMWRLQNILFGSKNYNTTKLATFLSSPRVDMYM